MSRKIWRNFNGITTVMCIIACALSAFHNRVAPTILNGTLALMNLIIFLNNKNQN